MQHYYIVCIVFKGKGEGVWFFVHKALSLFFFLLLFILY